jgi:hypothetical protein
LLGRKQQYQRSRCIALSLLICRLGLLAYGADNGPCATVGSMKFGANGCIAAVAFAFLATGPASAELRQRWPVKDIDVSSGKVPAEYMLIIFEYKNQAMLDMNQARRKSSVATHVVIDGTIAVEQTIRSIEKKPMKTFVKPIPNMVIKKTAPLRLISSLSLPSNSREYGG